MTHDTHTDAGPNAPDEGDAPPPDADVSTRADQPTAPKPRPADRASDTVIARFVRYDDQPDELTLTPRACPPDARLTTWISAQDGSFVDLANTR